MFIYSTLDLISNIICYHNDDFYVMWKPNALPTTFGKEICFLDVLAGKTIDSKTDFSIPDFLVPYIDLPDFKPCTLKIESIHHQSDIFGKEKELGLLNRLDNDTA